jgi:hypothetical protein
MTAIIRRTRTITVTITITRPITATITAIEIGIVIVVTTTTTTRTTIIIVLDGDATVPHKEARNTTLKHGMETAESHTRGRLVLNAGSSDNHAQR